MDMIGRLSYLISGLYLTLVDQVRNDSLHRVSGIPAEFGAAEVPRRKMDELGSTRFFIELHFLKRYVSSLNIFIWGVASCSHAACKNFTRLFAVRLVCGMGRPFGRPRVCRTKKEQFRLPVVIEDLERKLQD